MKQIRVQKKTQIYGQLFFERRAKDNSVEKG